MAKNTAKIKFSAETGKFTEAISKANSTMQELRAELKLNDERMKIQGESAENLAKKHELLSAEFNAAKDKTEALQSKLDAAVRIFGEGSIEVDKWRTQLINATTAQEKLKAAVDEAEAKLKAFDGSAEKLTDKVERQQKELQELKDKYVDVVTQQGKNSDEAKELAGKIKDLSNDLADNQTALGKAEKAADKLDDSFKNASDAAEQAGDGFTVAKGVIADFASSAVQWGIDKVSEFCSWLRDLPEATRDLRQGMATLDTSFETAGISSETATETFKTLYGVLGDEGRAIEAASLLAKFVDSEKELTEWTTIATGIFGSYGDSLPVEGLAEAANETSKTGQVTGVLADALNWSSEAAQMFAGYMSDEVTTAEDAFNEALKDCTTEEERQALITETLTALYGDAAAKYEETAGQQIAAKEATAENALVQNELANAIEPVTTAWDNLKATLTAAAIPAVEKVSGALQGALTWLQEHPTVAKAVAAAVGVLVVGLGALAVAATAYTVAQWAMNAAILANPIVAIIAGVVAAVALIVGIVVLVVENWELVSSTCVKAWNTVCDACSAAWQWICDIFSSLAEWFNTNVIQPVVNFFVGLWDGIVSGASSAYQWICDAFAVIGEWINTNVIQPVVNFFTGLWESIVSIWNGICQGISIAIQLIGSILSAAFQIITLPFMFIWENCKEYVFAAFEWIKEKVSSALSVISSTISNIWNFIVSVTSSVWSSVSSFISNIWNSIVSAVSSAVTSAKNKIVEIWTNIKNKTSEIFNSVKTLISNIWNSCKAAITEKVTAIKNKVSEIWTAVKNKTSEIFNSVKSFLSNIWESCKSAVTNKIVSLKNKVVEIWTNIKTKTTDVFSSVKNKVSEIWQSIKEKITKPIEQARDKIKGIVDKIKGFFSGMNISFPKIKMPHFGISPSGWKIGDLLEGVIPKLSIEWYAEGGILTRPTIFGMNGNRAMVGGEAGHEAILPIDRLEGYVSNAVEKTMRAFDISALADAVEELASRPVDLYVDGKRFAYATAGASDSVGGVRNTFKSRGLALD